MTNRAVLFLFCLVACVACGSGGGRGTETVPYTQFLTLALMTEEDYVNQSATDAQLLCLPEDDPVTIELTDSELTGTGAEAGTFYPVALLKIECLPGLQLAEMDGIRGYTYGNGHLIYRLDNDSGDGVEDFQPLGLRQVFWMAENPDGGDPAAEVYRSCFLQVLSDVAPVPKNTDFTIAFDFFHGDRNFYENINGETYRVRNCGDESKPPPDDPKVPIYKFDIPWQALDPFSITCVAEKDPLATCHAIIPDLDDGAQHLELGRVTDEITSFISGMAPSDLALLSRTTDRADGLLVSDSYLFVADDAPLPEGMPPQYSRMDLFRLDMETGDVYRLTRHREDGYSVGEARWSPSGDRIAYILRDYRDPAAGVSWELMIWDRATGNTVSVSDRVSDSLGWSPDGKTIMFASPEGDLWAVDADGSNERMILDRFDVHQGMDRIEYPDWHPTENKIVFVGKGTGNLRGGPLYVFDMDENEVTQITDGMNDGLEPLNESAEDRYPVWSPDGTLVAFVRLTDSSEFWELLILDVENGGAPIAIAGTREYRNLDW